MLMVTDAKTLRDLADQAVRPVPSGRFPWWRALLVETNHETLSAERLLRRDVPNYLPQFSRKLKRRGGMLYRRLSAVVPGLLFVPDEVLDIADRKRVFDYAHVHGFMMGTAGLPARLSKGEIEVIRHIEAKLNLPIEAKGVLFKVGQPVRFVTELYAAYLGDATIFEIAGPGRIGVEVQKLFGRVCKIFVSESEIEAM